MTGRRDRAIETALFARASRTCYAVVVFAAIVSGWLVGLNAFGIQVVPESFLPAFSIPSCVLLILIAAFGFYMYKIGRAYAIRLLRIASILIIAASLSLLVVISPTLIGISLSFYQAPPFLLADLAALIILSAVVLLVVSPPLFSKGIENLGTKLYLRGLKTFRRIESVYLTMMVACVLFAVVLAPLVFSPSRATVTLGSRLWGSALCAILGVGGIVLLILFAGTLGKLADPDILGRAVDAAARAPPEPRLFGLPVKTRGRYELPKSVRESFHEVESDKTFEFSTFGVRYLSLKKGNIFMLVPKVAGGPHIAYFIKLFNQMPTNKKRFKYPLVFLRKKHFSESIAGFPVAKFRGQFTLPVDIISKTEGSELRYASGSGIMYVVPRWDPSRGMYPPRAMFLGVDLSEKFDKTVVLEIIERLSKEIPDQKLKFRMPTSQ